ncbi:MAG TPA: glycerate kinase [Chthoniobacterales bacterium]|nr:glycerate kinase [Chthoniobacterales bacterium]
MRILIAPDKFKGCLNAREVAENIAAGLRAVLPEAVIETMPVADGGEGTAVAIHEAAGGKWIVCPAHDALGRAIEARYSWLADRSTAVMEMSEAAGLWRIAPQERDVLKANTFGVGEMIDHALKHGAKKIVVGLGGSATNDGGFGMARALGFRFFAREKELTHGSAELLNLTRIVPKELPGNLTALSRQDREGFARTFPKFTGAADVQNPLLGQRGATRVFGPQKGGTAEQLEMLERGLERLAEVVSRDLGCDFRDAPGAGAAGGLGFGLMSFCGATLRSGFELVAEILGLAAAIDRADVVITGEGRLDAQTLEGKAPGGVASIARSLGKPVHAIVGVTDASAANGLFDSVTALVEGEVSQEAAMINTAALLRGRARTLASRLRLN